MRRRRLPLSYETRRRGFVLLETLIAFAILAVMLGAAYRITGSGAATLARAEVAARVLNQMQSEFDDLLAGEKLTPGTETEALDDDFTRVRTVRRVRALCQSGTRTVLYRVEIAIYRSDNVNFSRPVMSLETLRVEPGGSGS
ncbi:prepilin-type N-terminal cleavage/methylation domain-containing protein [Breoghania sp.]|uniref:PulJ/GspJ family protein n=1 Tax=Breoghania sp. TaxID=2065378 RepID=UPI00260AF583|nr:prepilin-type N-terminal cleavage/methylation domain-containing protein [Breoghania sp.]MDJ0929781.1 prepilin-type N-terminal cleavage/methylation domain-containing protein [Breoghania sp.]